MPVIKAESAISVQKVDKGPKNDKKKEPEVKIPGRDGPIDHTVEIAYQDPSEKAEQKPSILM